MDNPSSLLANHPLGSRLNRFFKRFTRRPKAEQIQRWKIVEEQGRALEELMKLPGWQVVEEARQVYQRLRDVTLHMPTTPESIKHQASIEWNTLEEFFRDLRRRCYEGHKATEALAKVQTLSQQT